jgi:hypothetical protein
VVKNDWSIVSTPCVGLRVVDWDKFLRYEYLKQLLQPRSYSFYLKLSKEGAKGTKANLIYLTYTFKKTKKHSKIMLLKFTAENVTNSFTINYNHA